MLGRKLAQNNNSNQEIDGQAKDCVWVWLVYVIISITYDYETMKALYFPCCYGSAEACCLEKLTKINETTFTYSQSQE